MSEEFVGPVGSSVQEITNNNFPQDSQARDSNANDIQSREGKTLEEFISHSEEQEKIIIWSTDSQCDDPELVEFEMLECQELEVFLVESQENYSVHGTLFNCVSQTTDVVPKEIHKNKESHPDVSEQETVSYKGMSITSAESCVMRAELSSDNDAFVSCYSTMSSLGGSFASALDNTGWTQTSELWPVQTEPYRTLSDNPPPSCVTISERSRSSSHADGTHVDLNTTTFSEEPLSEAQENLAAHNTLTCKETSVQLINGRNESNSSTADVKTKHNEVRNTSEDKVGHCGNSTVERQAITREECKQPDAKPASVLKKSDHPFGSEDKESLTTTRFPQNLSHELKCKPFRSDETPDKSLKTGSVGPPHQCVLAELKLSQKQACFQRPCSASPTSLDRRKPWGSPSPSSTPPSHKHTCSPRRELPTSPGKTVSTRGLKPLSKSSLTSGLPKAIPPQHPSKSEPKPKRSPPAQKPKNVHPKIITSVHKSPHVNSLSAEGPYETSTLPCRPPTGQRRTGGLKDSPVPSSSGVLHNRYRQELQKPGYYSPPGLTVSGVRRSSHTIPQKLSGKSESFHGEFPGRHLNEVGRAVVLSIPEVAGVCCSPRALTPHLGLATRQPGARNRTLMSGQRSSSPLSHMSPPRQGAYCCLEPAGYMEKGQSAALCADSLL
ncbi:hypothetical protein P4O66_003235 [Electrophorus voltai]|uniref:Uncharacterized protein n=1 Tax=Electrophorus voltai TaxID=2609070 RepID=A0AAD9DN73_9TELE|nr:hypothetical protein P4O66_003235 [Electrophorus voltai]